MLATVKKYVQEVQQPDVRINLQELISLIDLTSLNKSDDQDAIKSLCAKAQTPFGNVAAVCLFPQFVKQAAEMLQDTKINVATVINFPEGTLLLDDALNSIAQAIYLGANEIDLVFPYGRYLAGDKTGAQQFVMQCKNACADKAILKVILETGALPSLSVVEEISRDVILAGANFIKTSTGKIKQGASLDAAAVILLTIKQFPTHRVGFKAAGGIRTIDQALQYYQLAQQIMGKDFITRATFRLGASQLLDVIVGNLS